VQVSAQQLTHQSAIQDTSSNKQPKTTSAIPEEKSWKIKPKKRHWIRIVPAKALQGSEPATPEKPIPKKEP